MKKNALISAVLTIALCASVIAGSTFALFTSNDEVNVAVTAGNVEVIATAENIRLSSTLGDNLPETVAEFIEGTNTLEISNIVPGDVIEFDLRVHNASNVTIAYRTVLERVTDDGLFDGLTVEIDGASYAGTTRSSAWTMAAPESQDIVVAVKIALPEDADNAYKKTSCTLAYKVEAVQGNASFADTLASVKEILAAGGEVYLMDDLTITREEAHNSPYGNLVGITQANGGVIDGNGKTLSYENSSNCRVILTYGGTIKNLTIVGGERGIVTYCPTEDVIIDNVVIDGPGYAFNTAELTTLDGIDLVVTNSTLKGWSSFNGGFETSTFANCLFGENTTGYWQNMGYDQDYDRLARPYTETLFDACTFEQDFYIDLSALAAGDKVTMKDCVAEDGTVITKDNYDQYITVELPSGRSLEDCVIFPVEVDPADFSSALANGDDVILTGDVTYGSAFTSSAYVDLSGNTFEATTTLNLTNDSSLTMKNGSYEANNSFGHVDVRPATAEGVTVVFEGVDFSYNKMGKTYGTCTNRVGSVVEFCGVEAGAKATFLFKNCTFDNAGVVFEGMSGKDGVINATFDGCTFNALTSSEVIKVANYVTGTLTVKNCTFNLVCTSATAHAISVSNSTSTSVVVNAENNTINATAATPYTYNAEAGEDETYNVKVMGTPNNITLVGYLGNTQNTSTVNVSGTVATGIAIAD